MPHLSDESRAYIKGRDDGIKEAITMINDGCGKKDCSHCNLVFTDCCEEPRFECQTSYAYDRISRVDTQVCKYRYGCAEDDHI